MPLDNQFALNRLTNLGNTAEGTNLPPRQAGQLRVPIVNNLRILNYENFLGGTTFTLSWIEPEIGGIEVSQYNVFATGINGIMQPQGLFAARRSPCVIRLTTEAVSNVVFIVQTQLNNGMVSPMETSPTVAAATIAPTINSSDLPDTGVAAGTYGSATQVGQFTVDSTGRLTNATNVTISVPVLTLSVVTKTSAYTMTANDYTVIGDTSGGSFSVKLPASPTTGNIKVLKKSSDSSNSLTLDGNGKNIDGSATVVFTAAYQSYTVQYNGTEWSIIARSI